LLPDHGRAATDEGVGNHDQDACRQPDQREHSHHSSAVLLKQGCLGLDLLQSLTDAPELGVHSGAGHFRNPLAGRHQRAREKRGEVVAARTLKLARAE
jgi:hypothetical protein